MASSGRRWARCTAGAILLLASRAEAAAPPLQAAIEAAYLAKFAPFVSWPLAAFAGPGAPLSICVQGDDPFDGALDRLAAGETVGAHPVQVRRVDRLDAASGCHIVFVAGSTQQSKAEALKEVSGAPVLTVADQDAVPAPDAIVRMSVLRGRVRFAIDAKKASQNGLSISSKLLAVASEVVR